MKKGTISLLVLMIALFTGSVNATDYFVKTDGSDANDGLSWATAKLTIASVGDMNSVVTVSGDKVYVAGGTYTIAAVIKPKSGVSVYGGYNATTGVRDLVANETIINGAGNRILQQSSSGPVLSAATLWDGFTITGGNKTSEGGGVSIVHDTAIFFTLSNCKVTGNTGSKGGGINAGACKIINCIIENNTATISAGGVYAYDKSGTIVENCIIRNNKVTAAGDANAGAGGVIIGGTTTMLNCLVYNNTSLTVAGGCDVQKQGKVYNCTFVNNSSPNSGGVRIGYNATVGGSITFQNNIVWNNSSASQFVAPSGSFQYINTCAFESGAPVGSFNLSAVNAEATGPNFVHPVSIIGNTADAGEIAIINATDLQLNNGSPCINAGTATDAPATSLNGVARPVGIAHDLGAYENETDLGTSVINPESKLISVYPNPVINEVILNVADIHSLTLIDMGGRAYSLTVNGSKADVSAFAKGIYTLVITTENQTYSARISKF